MMGREEEEALGEEEEEAAEEEEDTAEISLAAILIHPRTIGDHHLTRIGRQMKWADLHTIWVEEVVVVADGECVVVAVGEEDMVVVEEVVGDEAEEVEEGAAEEDR